MSKPKIKTTEKVVPMIYAYTTPEIKSAEWCANCAFWTGDRQINGFFGRAEIKDFNEITLEKSINKWKRIFGDVKFHNLELLHEADMNSHKI